MGIHAFLKGIKASYKETQSRVVVNKVKFLTVFDGLMG